MKGQKILRVSVWVLLFLFIAVNIWLIKINILGAQTSQPPDGNQNVETLDAEYLYWRKVIEDHPDYRDGFVRLATLAYQRGDSSAFREYLEKIRALDPNFDGLQAIEALLTK